MTMPHPPALAQTLPLACWARVAVAHQHALWQGREPDYLSAAEHRRWQAFPSAKRRLEFAAGRLAAKLAAHAARRARGRAALPLAQLQVLPGASGRPWLHAPGAAPQRLALSHAAGVAYAVCPVQPAWVGVDLVDPRRTLAFDADYFHPVEADSDAHTVDRMTCFAIKEATLKMLGCGLDAQAAGIRSALDDAGWRWVGLPAAISTQANSISYTLLHSTKLTTCVVLARPNRISQPRFL
jgi:phosphopantetheinyl transferase (holo-ACP synthase)